MVVLVCFIIYSSDDLSLISDVSFLRSDMVSDLFQGHKGMSTVVSMVWVEPSGVCCIIYLWIYYLLLICSLSMSLTWFPTCFRATKVCRQWSPVVCLCVSLFTYLLSFIIDVLYVDRSDMVSDLFHGHSGPQGVGGAQCLSVSSFICLLIYNLLLKYFISMGLT